MEVNTFINQEEFEKILTAHKEWANSQSKGERAIIRNAILNKIKINDEDLSEFILDGVTFVTCDIISVKMPYRMRNIVFERTNIDATNFSFRELEKFEFANSEIRGSNFAHAGVFACEFVATIIADTNFKSAMFYSPLIKWSDFKHCDFTDAYIDGIMYKTGISMCTGIVSNIDFLLDNFEKTDKGIIAYKSFNENYKSPPNWIIEPGSIISENVDFSRNNPCGCGINVATLDWAKRHCLNDIWKVLIRWEWLSGVCCPYDSDGKIRCERVEIIEKIERGVE